MFKTQQTSLFESRAWNILEIYVTVSILHQSYNHVSKLRVWYEGASCYNVSTRQQIKDLLRSRHFKSIRHRSTHADPAVAFTCLVKPTQSGLGLAQGCRARGDTFTHFLLTAAVCVPRAPPAGASVRSVVTPRSRCHGFRSFCSSRARRSTEITWQYAHEEAEGEVRARACSLSFPAGHERREGGEKKNENSWSDTDL